MRGGVSMWGCVCAGCVGGGWRVRQERGRGILRSPPHWCLRSSKGEWAVGVLLLLTRDRRRKGGAPGQGVPTGGDFLPCITDCPLQRVGSSQQLKTTCVLHNFIYSHAKMPSPCPPGEGRRPWTGPGRWRPARRRRRGDSWWRTASCSACACEVGGVGVWLGGLLLLQREGRRCSGSLCKSERAMPWTSVAMHNFYNTAILYHAPWHVQTTGRSPDAHALHIASNALGRQHMRAHAASHAQMWAMPRCCDG